MEIEEEPIALSSSNKEHLTMALQEKLRDFGLTKNESKIYVYLSKNGPQKAIEISKNENIPRTETYHLLSNLEGKGVVTTSIQKPTKFSAVAIETAIETIIQNHLKRIEELKILKNDMVDLWKSFEKINNHNKEEMSKIEPTQKKSSKSEKLKKDFKNKIKKIKQESDMSDD